MSERLFVLGISAYRPKLKLGRNGASREFDIPIGVTVGWAESPALAKEAALELVKREMPEERGFRQHDAAVREIPVARLEEWALRNGWLPASEAVPRAEYEALRARYEALKRKRGRQVWDEDEAA